MDVFKMEKEFNELIKHGLELIEKLKEGKELVKEADANDIGKLCLFWDEHFNARSISILECLQTGILKYKAKYGANWEHCRRLTPDEVSEFTGYRVEE